VSRVRRIIRRIRTRKINRSLHGNFLSFIVLATFGFVMVLPLVFAISNAFKPLDEIFLFPPRFMVINPTFDNFFDLFAVMSNSWIPFSRYLFNTVFITVVGTVGHVILASAAAYPLAKHKFPGSETMFRLVVLSLMFSATVTAIPNFLIIAGLGWLDTYWAIIVPAFASTLGLYLMKQFMERIPDTMIEAAKIDGASEYRIYWKIVMPMVKPAWLTLVILMFQSLWGATGSAFIFSEELKSMHFAVSQIMAGGIARAGTAAAVGVLLMIVPITVFIVSQSNIIETMASSGMKE